MSVEIGSLSQMSDIKDKIPIGISTCLLGEQVRFDGGHKRDRYITEILGQYFEWLSICPEVEIGLGIPRPTLRLERGGEGPRLIQPKTDSDLTEVMERFSQRRAKALQNRVIFGYLLKSKSPSCGMSRVKVYRGYGERPSTNGVGLFAKELMKALPNLPVEDEGRLCDPALRENWVNRVFAYHAFHHEVRVRPSLGKLVKFHTRYKFTILSHCDSTYRALGPLVADGKRHPIGKLIADYESLFMQAIKKKSTVKKNVNVMEHMLGFFKKLLDPLVRREILQSIGDYRQGVVPVIVPITLIKHYATILNVDYLCQQSYLNPHPKELALRSSL